MTFETVMETAQYCRRERSALFIVDREQRVLKTKTAHGADEIVIPLHKGVVGKCVSLASRLNIPTQLRHHIQ